MKKREALNQTAAEAVERLADLDKVIEGIQESLSDDEKSSVADLMRLLELRHESEQSQPARLRVRWIDECQQTPASDE